jgi:hypothetical protein
MFSLIFSMIAFASFAPNPLDICKVDLSKVHPEYREKVRQMQIAQNCPGVN